MANAFINPTKEQIRFAKKLCDLGATDQDLADAFDVSLRLVKYWKVRDKAFAEAVKVSKEGYDDKIERALAIRALGYSYEDVDIRVADGVVVQTPVTRHVPPDVTACIFWLKNRKRDKYRQNPDPVGAGDAVPEPVQIIEEDASKGE